MKLCDVLSVIPVTQKILLERRGEAFRLFHGPVYKLFEIGLRVTGMEGAEEVASIFCYEGMLVIQVARAAAAPCPNPSERMAFGRVPGCISERREE